MHLSLLCPGCVAVFWGCEAAWHETYTEPHFYRVPTRCRRRRCWRYLPARRGCLALVRVPGCAGIISDVCDRNSCPSFLSPPPSPTFSIDKNAFTLSLSWAILSSRIFFLAFLLQLSLRIIFSTLLPFIVSAIQTVALISFCDYPRPWGLLTAFLTW